ncbi:MAG TPA: tetratricopeptide repeat-containing protein [Candidatus Methylomirabilis sp.]|nr:tetratricopeptide repeat-containing protein [Candidatus Methylomirabilis sp.]
MARAFVIRPFGTKTDSSGKKIDFERVHRELIDPALKAGGLGGGTTGELVDSGSIREDMFRLILEADLVVCDITVHNANVFYELGIRHALRKKHTVLIKGAQTNDGTPFDLLTDRYLAYEVDDPGAAKTKLAEVITATLKTERATDSPIFQMLPSLPEADPSNVVVVPLDFREEVSRAQSASAKGWLRLLSEEVRRQQFQWEWEGLKLVANAQWDLQDYDGTRESWEAIRETYPKDIAANLALANIYERLYRIEVRRNTDKASALLEVSEQAIERVLGSHVTSRKQQAEALALKGRNHKTRWRLEFSDLPAVEERRKAAMNRALIRSYEAYRDAFFEDLNHFYPGLNALQMGTILLDLAGSDAWYDAFETDGEGNSYRKNLEEQVSSLRSLIPTSVAAALRRMDQSDPERIWAQISNADVLFLTDAKRERRVIGAYRDAIPQDMPFAWDATRGQLALFGDLGVQADLAQKVISEMDGRFADRQPGERGKPVHVVIFAGHRVDAPGRAEPRFPGGQEVRARALIREAISGLIDNAHEVVLLASAAPGADILAHEVCAELGLTSIICLPTPPEDFARYSFENLDAWRTRFLDLEKDHRENQKVLVLSDREGLPRWLHGSGMDPWLRGNHWVMEMALTWGAERVTLVALWDGRKAGDAPGGTAHMLKLAEDAGTVYIKRIDAMQLVQ